MLGEVDEGVEESKESNPEPLGHNVAPVMRPEVNDVPKVWCDSESEEDERPALGGARLQVYYLPKRW